MTYVKKKYDKWEPAQPARAKQDNLVSSPLFRNIKQFVPSYEKDDVCNMYYLLAWEYGRIWFAENKKWEKLMYGKDDKEELFRRSYCPKRPPKKVRVQKILKKGQGKK